jgi:hypothetical protein
MIKLKIKHLMVPILIAVTVLSILTYVVLAPEYVTYRQNVKHYNDSEISFDFPQNWVISDYENPIETFFLSEPENLTINRHDTISQNTSSSSMNQNNNSAPDITNPTMLTVTISKRSSLTASITLDNAYKLNENYPLIEKTPGYQFISRNVTTVDGVTAYEFLYGDETHIYYDVWFEKNGKFYGIACQTLTDSFNSEKTNFDLLINSFHVK